jgi:NitT/TauT family transport system ATP-binding protein
LWQRDNEKPKTIIFVTHDVDEAIILAGKVIVIGMNPGRVKEVHTVELPRPRLRNDLYRNDRSLLLRNHLVELMQEDVLHQLSSNRTIYPPGDGI